MKLIKNENCPFLGLTQDLILEVFLRLPLKSLGRCNTVCKTWNSLISDPEFAMSHMEFSNLTNSPLTLVSQKHNFMSTLKFDDQDESDITKGVRLVLVENQFPANECEDYYCFLIGSCHGLVCFYLKAVSKHRDDMMFIWNPVTDEREEIVLPDKYGRTYLYEDSCWFGYVPSEEDYKIFLVYSVRYKTQVYIYSLKEKPVWREVHAGDEVPWSQSVFMDDSLHWLSGRKWIVKFDLVEETFERVPFSINEPGLFENSRDVLLSVIGGYDSLCAMFVQYPVQQILNTDSEEESEEEEDSEEKEDQEQVLELWMLEEYDNWDSWKRFYRIELQDGIFRNPIQVIGFTYYGIVCIRVEHALWLFDPSDDPPSYAIVRDPRFAKVYKVTDYVESLVSPFNLP